MFLADSLLTRTDFVLEITRENGDAKEIHVGRTNFSHHYLSTLSYTYVTLACLV